ncbi:MAG: S8 family serine peptidase [Bacteroidota bacterium]
MKKYLLSLSCLIGMLLFVKSAVQAQKIPPKGEKLLLHSKNENAIPNQFIVVLDNEFLSPYFLTAAYKRLKNREQKAEGLKAYQKQARVKLAAFFKTHDISPKSVKKIYAGGLVGFTAILQAGQLKRLQGLKLVKYIEQDARLFLPTIPSKIDIIKPQKVSWGTEFVGSGDGRSLENIAFVIDTGIDQDHPDLNVNRSLSTSMIAAEPGKDDQHGHGTHCAGIIAAKDNFIGSKGVAAGATVVGVKALNRTGSGSWSDILAAVSYSAIVANPGDVVNMSLGGRGTQWILGLHIQLLLGARGIFVCISAGNDNIHASNYAPANVNGARIYTVSNMDENRDIAASSNFGNAPVDFAAPGSDIYSTDKDGTYSTKSGTSMAAPHLAGILLINRGSINTNGRLNTDKDPVKDKIAVK